MEDLGRLEYRFSIEAKNFLSLLRQGVEGLVPEPRQRLFLYQTLLTKLVMNKAPVDSHKLTMVHAWPNFWELVVKYDQKDEAKKKGIDMGKWSL